MTFNQAVVQCVQSIHLTKPVNAVIQIKSGDIVIACEDKHVYLYTLTNGLFELRTKIQTSKVPHTIGYDYVRHTIYVGCDAGYVDVIQLLNDDMTQQPSQERQEEDKTIQDNSQVIEDDVIDFKSEFIQETYLNPRESLMAQYDRFLRKYHHIGSKTTKSSQQDDKYIRFDDILSQLQERKLVIDKPISSFKQMKHLARLQPSKREICHILYARDSDVILCAGFDGMLTIFNAETREIISTTQLSKTPVRYLCYDQIGGLLYTGTHEQGIACFRLRNAATGETPKFEFMLGNDGTELSHEHPVRSIIMDKQSRFIFSSDHKGKILVWQAGEPSKEECTEAIGEIFGCENLKIRSLRWIPSHRALISGDSKGCLTVHNPCNKRLSINVQGHRDQIMGLAASTITINQEETDCTISFSKDGVVKIWNITFT